MKKLLVLFALIMAFGSCKKTSENPEDYINFMVNNDFQMKYLKYTKDGTEWERGGVQKGILNTRLLESGRIKYSVKTDSAIKYSIFEYWASDNKHLGDIVIEDVKRIWASDKSRVGVFKFKYNEYRIDLDKETIKRTNDNNNITEVYEKAKS